MIGKIELRVHAGAPSSRRDDDRCRALAEGYIGFTGRSVNLDPSQGIVTDPTEVNQDRHASLPLQLPQNNGAHDESIAASSTVLHRDETTFVEDTQLAYNALESQLQTSSLTVPEVTPAKRSLPANFGDESPWPDDLEKHSPEALRSFLPEVDDILEKPDAFPVLDRRPVKRPRFQQNAPKQPILKAFQIPTKGAGTRKGSTPDREKPSRAPADRTLRTPSDRDVSQSSYLKTPNLVTPEYVRSAQPGTPAEKTPSPQLPHEERPAPPHERYSTQSAPKGKLPDYRERTPRQQLNLPYVPLKEGSQVGLAFVGQQLRGEGAQHNSQLSGSGAETTSELPTSYSLSDITSESSRARLKNSQRSTSDPGPLFDGNHGSNDLYKSARSTSQPPRLDGRVTANAGDGKAFQQPAGKSNVTKMVQVTVPPPTASPDCQVPISGAARDEQQTSPKPPATASSPSRQFNGLALTIRPPEPAVSVERFSSHITDSLRWLAESSALVDNYKPVSVSRDLRPLERGYWLVHTTTWPAELQSDFWRFLEKMVGNANAGWGVWCSREGQNQFLGNVQVYCWGEVVKHVYLMLYVASKSKVRKAGLQWFDAEEKVVVQMRGPA